MKLWIGLVQVTPTLEGSFLEGASGAFVNVTAYANNIIDYKTQVKKYLSSINLQVETIEDVELLEERMKDAEQTEQLLKLTKSTQPNTPALGTFHSFDSK